MAAMAPPLGFHLSRGMAAAVMNSDTNSGDAHNGDIDENGRVSKPNGDGRNAIQTISATARTIASLF
jgi:hypothetical protein